MSKFKRGDKVVCVQESKACGVVLGGRYTVKDPDYMRWEASRVSILLEEVGSCPYESCFELAIQDEPVVEYAVLTTKEVTEYFLNGRENELEFLNGSYWSNALCNMAFCNIKARTFRMKKTTIDYYGTALPKPVDVNTLPVYDTVYAIINGAVVGRSVSFILSTCPQNPLLFSTRVEAELVLSTIYKPFL